MNRTKIEWVKNPDGTQGYTWNPVTGCLNNCSYCYARKLANGRLKSRYLANENVAPKIGKDVLFREYQIPTTEYTDPFYPRFWEDRLHDYGLGMCEPPPKKKRGIFVCDMSDLFGIGIPEEWQRMVFEVIKANPWHRFYLLTKQPQNLPQWSPFPDNCWVGVTATGAKMAREALRGLLDIKAKVKYISFEPLLERIYIDCAVGIQWVIIGAQTKPYKPPKIEWVREIVEACDKAGIPVFLKNNLNPLLNRKNYMTVELRQELPSGIISS